MAARPPLEVSVPDADMDRPRFARLAVIALVCFAAGLVWPWLLGKSLVQRPPGAEKKERGEPAVPQGEPDLGAPPREADTAETAIPAAHLAAMPTTEQSARINGMVIVSCRSASGERAETCDEPGVTPILESPIAKLAKCEGAEGASGVLSLGLELDFVRGRVVRVKAGKSTTLSGDKTAALMACAEEGIVGTRIAEAAHRHAAYWLYYMVQLTPPGALASAAPQIVPASGQGTIGWKTVVVRAEPSRQAKIVSRLLYGTRVSVSGRAGEWYRIDFDGSGSTGWVHRDALGM